MSIEDDSFDVESEVKGTSAEQAFDRFMAWAFANQEKLEQVESENRTLREAIRIVGNNSDT